MTVLVPWYFVALLGGRLQNTCSGCKPFQNPKKESQVLLSAAKQLVFLTS